MEIHQVRYFLAVCETLNFTRAAESCNAATRAKDIVMRSRRLRGRQAYELGVATECVADRELEAATDAA
jgi:DNA-binding transcriptional LysR family regulator